MNNKIIYVDFSTNYKKTTIKKKVTDFLNSIFKYKEKSDSENKGKLMVYDDFRHIL